MHLYFSSLKSALMDFIWPISVIGIPAVYFGLESSVLYQVAIFAACFFLLFLLYIICCVLIHKFKMRSPVYAANYEAMPDIEKGKVIGGALGGW